MPVQRLSEKIAPWIQESLERHAMGDEITWEIIPAPQGAVLLHLAMPHVVLSEQVQGAVPLAPAMQVPEAIEAVVQAQLENMRNARSKAAAEVPIHGSNGHGPGHNALGG